MAMGREQIRDYAIGIEMDGFDGWHYDYQATVIDEKNAMVIGLWKQRSGIIDDSTGKEFEIPGLGGSWFGVERQADGRAEVLLAARLVRLRRDGPHDGSRAEVRQGARHPARAAPGRSVSRCLVTTGPRTCRRRVWPPPVERGDYVTQDAGVTAPAAAPHRRQADAVERRGDVPDPQPGHRRRDRPGAGRHGRRRRRRDRGGPPRVRRDRLVDRPRAAGALPAAAARRRCWPPPTTSRR